MTPAAIRSLAHRIARANKATIRTSIDREDEQLIIETTIGTTTRQHETRRSVRNNTAICNIETALTDRGVPNSGFSYGTYDPSDGTLTLIVFLDDRTDSAE